MSLPAPPAQRGSMPGNYEDPPALFASLQGAGALVADTVELHRGQAQMATVTAPADQPRHSDPSETRPQAIVRSQQGLRDGLNGSRALRRQLCNGGFKFGLGGPQPFEGALLAVRKLCELAVQRRHLSIEGLALLHEREDLVLELRGAIFQAFDVFCHGLKLA